VFQINSPITAFVPINPLNPTIRQPSLFQQNVDFRQPQPQSVRVAQPPPVRVAPQQPTLRAQVPQRRPQPQQVPAQPARAQPQPVRVQPQPVRAQPQPLRAQPQPVRQQPQPVQPRPQVVAKPAPVRTNLFPSFELPDFFRIPFVAFRSLDPASSSGASNSQPAAAPAQNTRGALFNSIGLPNGQVQGLQRPQNLNILSGSYSYTVGGVGRR